MKACSKPLRLAGLSISQLPQHDNRREEGVVED